MFIACRLYNSIWRFAGVRELTKTFIANVIVVFFHVIVITLFLYPHADFILSLARAYSLFLTLAIRFAYRYLLQLIAQNNREKAKHNVMIIGAGAAGQMVTKELLLSNRINAKPVCIIDDNSNKWNRYIDGVPVVGGREYILTAIQEYDVDQIFFAIPTAKPEEKRDILNICQESKCEIKSLPGVYQLANGEVLMSKMHPVELEDLLGREPIKVDMEDVFQQIRGRRILVTGGGGSIGSELCRQIAAHSRQSLADQGKALRHSEPLMEYIHGIQLDDVGMRGDVHQPAAGHVRQRTEIIFITRVALLRADLPVVLCEVEPPRTKEMDASDDVIERIRRDGGLHEGPLGGTNPAPCRAAPWASPTRRGAA